MKIKVCWKHCGAGSREDDETWASSKLRLTETWENNSLLCFDAQRKGVGIQWRLFQIKRNTTGVRNEPCTPSSYRLSYIVRWEAYEHLYSSVEKTTFKHHNAGITICIYISGCISLPKRVKTCARPCPCFQAQRQTCIKSMIWRAPEDFCACCKQA